MNVFLCENCKIANPAANVECVNCGTDLSDPRYIWQEEIGIGLRTISALWFAAAATVPVCFFLSLFGGPAVRLSDSGFPILWIYGGSPISAAALCGFVFGAKILDPWKVETAGHAGWIGLKTAMVSYIVFLGTFSFIMGISAPSLSIPETIYCMIVIFIAFGFYGSILVGWLIVISGTIAGLLLFKLSRAEEFESRLFDTQRISKPALRKVTLALAAIFLSASVAFVVRSRTGAESDNSPIKTRVYISRPQTHQETLLISPGKMAQLVRQSSQSNLT